MIQKAFIRMARATLRPRFAFSQQTKTTQDKPPQTENKPEQSKEQTVRQDREGREEQEEDQPFQKQNRNTIGWLIYRILFWGTFSALSYNIYLVYFHNKKTPVEDQPGAVPYIITAAKTIVNSANEFIEFVTQPPSKKLLPDTIHPDLHPKTLLLNLTGTIIKSQYVFGKGQKITLRPGLEKMLKRLSNKYEIVVFAEEDEHMLMSPIMKIDPKMQHFRGVLGRQSMVWKDGEFIKDLRYLNRDLRKVVAVDSHPKNLKNQPKNAIIISEFLGDEKDNELQKVALLLDRIATVPDVRKFLQSLGQNPVETYYKKMMQAQQKMNKKVGFFGGWGSKNNNKKENKSREEPQDF